MTDPTAPAAKRSDPDDASRKPDICVLMNAGSGDRKGEETARVLEDLFARHPGRFELRALKSGKEIAPQAKRAARAGFRTVVAAGGDGTICAVASSLVGTDCRLGVLPLGTFNYFARSLDLPDDLEAAVEILVAGHSRPVSLGEVNGEIFLNNASLGAYPAILQNREAVYRRWGRSRVAAYWSVLQTLATFHAPLRTKITVDGTLHTFKTPLVFVASNAFQLEELELEGAECIRSGHFAVFVAPDSGRLGLVRNALRLASQTAQPGRDFELLCGADVVVESRRKHSLVARDGERDRIASPFRFRFLRDALQVVAPERSVESA